MKRSASETTARSAPADAPATEADRYWMRQALRAAARAGRLGEVPVGAVVVVSDVVIGRGRNSPVGTGDPTAHAEILALRQAARAAGNYRLEEATVYSTLEPCVMCAGALVAARVRRLVFGGRDLRFGGVRSKFRVADSELLNHRLAVRAEVIGRRIVFEFTGTWQQPGITRQLAWAGHTPFYRRGPPPSANLAVERRPSPCIRSVCHCMVNVWRGMSPQRFVSTKRTFGH